MRVEWVILVYVSQKSPVALQRDIFMIGFGLPDEGRLMSKSDVSLQLLLVNYSVRLLILQSLSPLKFQNTYPEIGDGNFNITHSHFID